MLNKSQLLIKPLVRYYGTIGQKSIILSKNEVTNRILTAKSESNITFEQIAHKLGKNKV